MKFSDAVINVLLHEEAAYGPGRGMTCRELERLGTSFHIPRREARGIINALAENRVIISTKKLIDGKREKIWTVNRNKLNPVGP